MQHFALNEQEINARSGLLLWANEQAIREIYLRPFEITVKEGQVTGAMSSFIHIGYKWSGGNPELLQNVLRDEWGFVGIVSTDAVPAGSRWNCSAMNRSGDAVAEISCDAKPPRAAPTGARPPLNAWASLLTPDP